MPIYEYLCRTCRRRVQIITLRASVTPDLVCDHCGGRALDRLPSRFSLPRSEQSRMERLADPSRLSGLAEDDPRSVARWLRRMGQEAGEDVAGPELDEMIEEIETGANVDDGPSSEE